MDFIRVDEREGGKENFISHNSDFEVELYFNDSLLQVQYTELHDGVFMPCIDLAEFECNYTCLNKEGISCPFYKDSKEVTKSEITYFQIGNGKKVMQKVKDWLLGVCDSEDRALIIEEEWKMENGLLSDGLKMDF